MGIVERLMFRLLSGLNSAQLRQLKKLSKVVMLNRKSFDIVLATALRRNKPCRPDSIIGKGSNELLFSFKIIFPSAKGFLTGEMRIEIRCEDRKLFNAISTSLSNMGVMVDQNTYPYYKCIMGSETASLYHDAFHTYF